MKNYTNERGTTMKYLHNFYYAIGLCNLIIAVETKSVYWLILGIILITSGRK